MNHTDEWSALERRLDSMTSPDSQTGLVFLNRVLRCLRDPQDILAIHVAGTNGKGSTVAALAAMLGAAGYKTALYTSPHLEVIGERLRINGEMLSVQAWHTAFDAVEKALKKLPDCRLGYFQIFTAAAFWLLKRECVDVAVIETGLGGRNDATNALTNPLLSVITPLGIDHTHLLGNTLDSIAAHKFGIIKSGSKALFCGSPASQSGLFKRTCAAVRTQGEVFAERCAVSSVSSTLDGNEFVLRTPKGTKRWFTRLAGAYQPENAALALRALELVAGRLPVSDAAKRIGLATVTWPGRMEVFHKSPDLILDGAHNPHGAQALARSLRGLYGAQTPLSFVYASMADKDYLEALGCYARTFANARLFCTELDGFVRCEKAQTLARKASALPWLEKPQTFADPDEALRAALDAGGPVVVCGSLYFIARMRERVRELEL